MARVVQLNGLTKLSDRWSVVVHVLRKWTVYKKTNPAEGFCTSMILIDSEGTRIQGSIVGKGLYERFHDLIHEGKTYSISNFEVIDNAKDYKATPHTYRLLFSASTHVHEETVDLDVKQHQFVSLDEVAHAEESCYPDFFVDVMALVRSFGSLEEYDRGDGKKTKLRLTIADLSGVEVQCVLYDRCAARAFREKPDNPTLPVSVVIAFARISFNENGYPQLSSSYNATRVSYDPPLPEVVELTKKAIAIGFGPPQLLTDCVLDSGSSSSSPVHTRNRFRVALDDIVNQEMGKTFTVDVTILKLETRHGWTYDGCVKCSSKPRMEDNKLYCPGCKKRPSNVEPKLKLHYLVGDATGTASVVFWDKLARELLHKTAPELKAVLAREGREYDFPSDCDAIVGKRMRLALKKNEFNEKFSSSSVSVQNFTMGRNLIAQFEAAADDGTENVPVPGPIDIGGDISPPVLRARKKSTGKRPAEDSGVEVPDCSTPVEPRKTLRAVKKERY